MKIRSNGFDGRRREWQKIKVADDGELTVYLSVYKCATFYSYYLAKPPEKDWVVSIDTFTLLIYASVGHNTCQIFLRDFEDNSKKIKNIRNIMENYEEIPFIRSFEKIGSLGLKEGDVVFRLYSSV